MEIEDVVNDETQEINSLENNGNNSVITATEGLYVKLYDIYDALSCHRPFNGRRMNNIDVVMDKNEI